MRKPCASSDARNEIENVDLCNKNISVPLQGSSRESGSGPKIRPKKVVNE